MSAHSAESVRCNCPQWVSHADWCSARSVAPEVHAMSQSVAALALELPDAVWQDVAAKWVAVLRQIDGSGGGE